MSAALGRQFAVLQAVSHVDPGQHAQNGDNRHEWKPEWAELVGFRVAQDHDTDTDQDKGKESADVRHDRRIADGNQGSECGHADAGENGGIVRRAIARMHG